MWITDDQVEVGLGVAALLTIVRRNFSRWQGLAAQHALAKSRV
jgi:hypothetical protein